MSKQVEDAASKRKSVHEETDPLDNEELVSKVGDKLSNLFGTGKTSETSEVEDDTEVDDDVKTEDDQEIEDDTEIEDDQEVDDSKVEDDAETDDDSETDGEELKPVPQAYLQAAKAYGWSEDKVRRMLKLDRDTALETLEGIYNTRNQINAHYSKMGRRANSDTHKDDAPPKIDTKALRESMGEEAGPLIDLIEKQGTAINTLLADRNKNVDDSHLLPDLDRRHQSAVDELGVEQQINTFFESDAMKPFNKVYGNLNLGQTMEDLPAGQKKYRWEVLKKADAIAGGAKMQGREVSLQEALIDAHLLVSQGFRDKVLIDGIRSKVTKRSKGRTLKPSKGHRQVSASESKTKDGKRTEQQLLQVTQSRLNKIFR